MKKRIVRYLIPFFAGAAITVAICAAQGAFLGPFTNQTAAAISDGAFVSGILLVGIGALLFSSNQGAFSGLTYSVRRSVTMHWPWIIKNPDEDYYSYLERKKTNGVKIRYLMIPGLSFILIAAVTAILFHIL